MPHDVLPGAPLDDNGPHPLGTPPGWNSVLPPTFPDDLILPAPAHPSDPCGSVGGSLTSLNDLFAQIQQNPILSYGLAGLFTSRRSGRRGGIPTRPLAYATLDTLDGRVEDALTRLNRVKGFSKKTLVGYRTDYRAFRGYLLATNQSRAFLAGAPDTQARILEGWLAALRVSEKSVNTIATYWRGLQALFNHIAAEDRLFNPMLLLDTPQPGATQRRPASQADFDHVVRYVLNRQEDRFANLRDLALVFGFAHGGLRNGELRRLTVSDVDFEHGVLWIQRGKGPNGGTPREAYLSPQGWEVFRAYTEARRHIGRTHPEFFSSIRSDSRIGEVTIRRVFARIEFATGVYVRPHMLRHTFATRLDEQGIGSAARLAAMGQRSPRVLQQYTHTSRQACQDALRHLTSNVDIGRYCEADGLSPKRQLRDAPSLLVVPTPEVPRRRDETRVARERLDDVNGDTGAKEQCDE